MSQTTPGRVLVVDDELQLMDTLVEALNGQGYVAHGFLTGVEAIEALQKQEFDLLLTDLMMPEMDGITLLKACAAIDPNLMGVVMTGQGTVPTAVEAMKTGAFDYVLKPFRLEMLLPVLKRAMQVRNLRMENIQLRETVAIYNLSQSLTLSLDSKLILQATADTALQQLDADEVSIMLLRPESQELHIAAVRGKGREHLLGQHRSLQEGIAGWVARHLEPLILSGEVSDPRFAPIQPRPGIPSAICMPMVTAGKLIGVLNANRFQARHPFTVGQVKALSILTSAAAAALENEALYRTLEAREKRFRALIENSADAIALLKGDGTILFESPAATRILGYEAEEMIGRNAFEFLHPSDADVSAELFGSILKTPGGAARGVFRYHHKDDSYRWVEAIGTNLLNEASVQAMVVNYRDITERKQAEEAQRVSEERFRRYFELGLIGMAITSPEKGFIEVNDQTCEILGYERTELMQIGWDRLTHPNDMAADLHHFNQLLAGQIDGYSLEKRFIHKDGGIIHTSISVNSVRRADGSVDYLVALMEDITERKQAEEQIQRQLQQLNALRTIDIAISSSFDLDIILDVILQQVLAQLGVDASAVLLFDSQSQTIKYASSLGFHSDALHYTQLKSGEGYAGRAMRERKTIHILDFMETGGRLATSLLLEHESFVDYYSTPLIVKGEIKGVLEIYHRSHLRSNPEWLEFLETLAGQAAIAIDNAQLFENLQRSNLNLERRVVERTAELNHTNLELERANRAKDEFLANMSHELRTPLTSVLGLSESLMEQRRGSLNEDQQRSIQMIESSGRHLLELINDILDLSKIEAGKFDFYPQPIAVDEFCRSCLAFVKAQAMQKSIAINYTNTAPVSKIFADPRRLKQILVNLLTNAVKFTYENGQVSLRVEADPQQDLIQFSVSDTGIGISPEDLQQLFQPFVQVDSGLNRQQDGTGLGLALVQRLTDLHGGSVEVESEVGKGSRFTINLSCKQDEITDRETQQSPGMASAGEQADIAKVLVEESVGRGVILLADDNKANIMTIGEYLESHGYEVVIAHDGFEAIEKAQAVEPDIILMDIQMPSLDGLEAMRRLRSNSQFADTPMIALTALAMPGDRERCLRAGASEYLSKPVSLKTLRQTIENILQTRSGT